MELNIGVMIFQIIALFLMILVFILIPLFIIKYLKQQKKTSNSMADNRKEQKEDGLVWYASYGSNLNDERFLCYIKGGRPDGSTKIENGASDKTLPRKDRSIKVPYPLYFAKYSSRWNGAVAFIGKKKDEQNYSYGRMYLITKEQFVDVVKQENSTSDILIDFKELEKQGQLMIRKSWYGNIIYLGEEEGYPIYTFTAYWDMEDAFLAQPSVAYLKMLMIGLIRLNFSTEEIIEYFSNKPGVKDQYSEAQLKNIVDQLYL